MLWPDSQTFLLISFQLLKSGFGLGAEGTKRDS